MLTVLFLSVAIPFPPITLTRESAFIHFYKEDPTNLVLFVYTDATHKVQGEWLVLKRDHQAPPKVLLLQMTIRVAKGPNVKFDSDQHPSYEVNPYRPDRDGELTEVRIRDPYGREISRFPVKYPKPRPK
jgi:hypothetical protein